MSLLIHLVGFLAVEAQVAEERLNDIGVARKKCSA
ncbi:hypothetical protein PDIG_48980 [Penicillium digitatum PHI26]|uniref:Uncharacterized protein n=2 Tax=Penicillium digitatum TaxID=36651 RepID=K9FT26_PEND2|nr:hypothetical protein PDIP_58360 [Penicillium digitatum Pd1]EKV10796.1 hypothetical protein PDIP_58360 [Penicillium digitatum Pd1]EKV11672.1 hypothetical protein PDIG_48980 [Penicillium digitatum PHI26]